MFGGHGDQAYDSSCKVLDRLRGEWVWRWFVMFLARGALPPEIVWRTARPGDAVASGHGDGYIPK